MYAVPMTIMPILFVPFGEPEVEVFGYKGTPGWWLIGIFYGLAVVAYVPPFLMLLASGTRRAVRLAADPQRCGTCGYDLQMTEGRCPECNTPVSAKQDRERRRPDEIGAALHDVE
jgi:hypothetical protein